MEFTLSLIGTDGIRKTATATENAYLTLYKEYYNPGDYVELTGNLANQYFVVQIDATFKPALVYMTTNSWFYPIPFEENIRLAMHPYAFQGDKHYISVRRATDSEIQSYQNLALNTHDQKLNTGMFPHSHANVETRDEAIFYARNAIDGIFANDYHGKYPYQSWGINRQSDAAFTLDFGRPVEIDLLKITLRADFPHDSYWTQATVSFDDGSQEILSFVKSANAQSFPITKRTVQQLIFHQLRKNEDDSPFPALTQIEVFGYNVNNT